MLVAAEIIFWLCLAIVVWEIFAFPAILWLLARLRPMPVKKTDITPSVAVVITVHNEASVIAQKIENTQALDYPADKIEIIIADDASDDATEAVVRPFLSHRLKYVRQDAWKGKTAAQNLAVAQTEAEIVFFTDATALLEKGTLRALVRNFADTSVGCVTGKVAQSDNSALAGALSRRLTYEQRVRAAQGAAYSLFGATGCIYAVRRALYRPVPEDQVSDLVLPLMLLEEGLRTVYEPEAFALIDRPVSTGRELARRSRVILQSLRAMWHMRRLLACWRSGIMVSTIAWYRLLRWLLPIFLLFLLIANALLARLDSPVYFWLLFAQLSFYSIALLGGIAAAANIRLPVAGLPFLFIWVNIAALFAIFRLARGEKAVVWQTSCARTAETSQGLLSKIASYWRNEGAWAALRRALATVAAFFYSRRTIIEFIIPCAIIRDIPPPAVSFELVEYGPENLSSLDKCSYHPTAALQSRFADKQRCFVALVEGDIAACAWVVPGDTRHKIVGLQLEKGQAYIYNVRTLRNRRGQGIYPALLAGITLLLAKEGFAQALIRADAANTASIRGIEKAGFEQKAIIRRGRILGFSWQKTEPATPEKVDAS